MFQPKSDFSLKSDFCRHGEEATGSNYTIYLEVAGTYLNNQYYIVLRWTKKILIIMIIVEVPGTFTYCYNYCWGTKNNNEDEDHHDNIAAADEDDDNGEDHGGWNNNEDDPDDDDIDKASVSNY